MMDLDTKDIYALPLRKFAANIMVAMAGHVATEIFMGEPWTGMSGDLRNIQAQLYALIHFGQFGKFALAAEDPLKQIDKKEVEGFITNCMESTKSLLIKHKDEVDIIAQALLERKELSGDEVYELLPERPD